MGNNSEWEEVKPSVNPNNEWVDVSNQAKTMGMVPINGDGGGKVWPAVGGAVGGLIGGFPGAILGAGAGSSLQKRLSGQDMGDNPALGNPTSPMALGSAPDLLSPSNTNSSTDAGIARDATLYGALPQGIAKLQGAAAKGLQSASDQADVTDLVKDPAKLGSTVAGKLQDAQTMYNNRVINPKMQEQNARADGVSTKFDIDGFTKAYPEVAAHPEIAEHLESMKNYKPDPYGQGGRSSQGGSFTVGESNNYGHAPSPGPQGYDAYTNTGANRTQSFPSGDPSGYPAHELPVENEYASYSAPQEIANNSPKLRAREVSTGQGPSPMGAKQVSMPGGATTKEYFNNTEVPVKDLLELRSKLNGVSDYKPGDPFATEAAKARYEQAQQAGDAIRSKIAEVDPNIADISQDLRQDYNTRNAVMKTATKRPISTVVAKPGTDKASNLARFDQAAGSDLGAMGAKIATGASQMGAPSDIIQTSGDWKSKLWGLASRGGGSAAQAVNPLMQKLNKPNLTANTLRALGVSLDAPAGSGNSKE